ncbi:hypothetical protein AJ80_09249 [Polytolypa hystricis UAMH7299]|uniref:Roadblock/LAMTOR2 domain-containing protein n=1 Tax=Polytolypa hystricis (strain UAMH7299) TaxID=1447883 RepID=A0A2B7WU56_POLH7|nr:hypothetical protein AJ80_09249 [Polytolypa hystricis UAMH7299]
MATYTTTPLSLPPHVSAQLSHLASRPGVQSTLILSRKDGSIIQTTGLLALQSSPNNNNTTTTPAAATPPSLSPPTSEPPLATSSTTEQSNPTPITTENAPNTVATSVPYKPSPAELIASHIFAFVSSASALSASLSSSSTNKSNEAEYRPSIFDRSDVNGNGHGKDERGESDAPEREEEDEVRLLRLRTKVHEIIIIPGRRFLLCVVHDVSGGATGPGGGGGGGAHSR